MNRTTIELIAIAALLAIFGAIYAGQRGQIATLKVQLADERTGRASDRAAAASAAASAAADNAKETDRRLAAQARSNDEAIKHEQDLRADAVRNAAATAGLLSAAKARLARAAASHPAGGDPAAVAPGAAGAPADVVFTDMLEWSLDRGDELATALDLAHARGKQCEAAYDSLSDKTLRAGVPLDLAPGGEPGERNEDASDTRFIPAGQLVAGGEVTASP